MIIISNSLTWTKWSAGPSITIISHQNPKINFNPDDYNLSDVIEYQPDINAERNSKWITSRSDYLSYIDWKQGWVGKLKRKLDTLALVLNEKHWYYVDPIKYLIFLYYQEKYSILDIFDLIKNIWFNYKSKKSNSLVFVFRSVFWWDLRNPQKWSYRTIDKRIKRWSLWTRNATETNNIRNKEKQDMLIFFITIKVNNILINDFDKNLYENYNRFDKIMYILWLVIWINKLDLVYINERLWIGLTIITNILNEKIKFFIDENWLNLTIYKKDISKIINEI